MMDYKAYFESSAFQEKWQQYKNFFSEQYGIDINLLFYENYETKVRFTDFFRAVSRGNLFEAYSHLKPYQDHFETDKEKQIFTKFKEICFNLENMSKVKAGDWVKDESHGYWNVLKAKNGTFTIKNAFDRHPFNFRKKFNSITTDLKCFQNISAEEQEYIDEYFSKNPADYERFNRFTNKYAEYCDLLGKFGVCTGSGRFYKYLSEQTAFIINIEDCGDYIFAVYGISNVSLFKDYRDFFEKNGADNESINIRRCFKLKNSTDERELTSEIKSFLAEYGVLTKDEILAKSQAIRKEFMKMITDKLKPLGFKKKSNHWFRMLENSFYIEFSADKSSYSDLYDFNLYIFKEDSACFWCYRKVATYNDDCIVYNNRLNWQLTSKDAFLRVLESEFEPEITYFINTPQEKWGNDKKGAILLQRANKELCEICPFNKLNS